jgi:hypothetical protein
MNAVYVHKLIEVSVKMYGRADAGNEQRKRAVRVN